MKEINLLTFTPKLPNEYDLKKQSLRFISMDSWVRSHLVKMASAQLALETAHTAYSLTCTPKVPIQAFNRALASRPSTE